MCVGGGGGGGGAGGGGGGNLAKAVNSEPRPCIVSFRQSECLSLLPQTTRTVCTMRRTVL